jgi:hypothetical protein
MLWMEGSIDWCQKVDVIGGCKKIMGRMVERIGQYINLLKTKRRLLYLNAQSAPRCKHFSSQL